ncbi:hypothetical protein HNQ77_002333 [Silvibacterium bohemicum]|uniref:Uncharacterized protein n=1 Tax=Silvibacterium bohemicum TaxID=1577686 RepID=A0A841JZJ3_9BACT|nr:hypothetical protein [Silvibacterium bohemicum]
MLWYRPRPLFRLDALAHITAILERTMFKIDEGLTSIAGHRRAAGFFAAAFCSIAASSFAANAG